jgi:hypothetical protein
VNLARQRICLLHHAHLRVWSGGARMVEKCSASYAALDEKEDGQCDPKLATEGWT